MIRFLLDLLEKNSNPTITVVKHFATSKQDVNSIILFILTDILRDNLIKLEPNKTTFIHIGNMHSPHNSGTEQLVDIEVQCGDCLGEDNIVRYGGLYGQKVSPVIAPYHDGNGENYVP